MSLSRLSVGFATLLILVAAPALSQAQHDGEKGKKPETLKIKGVAKKAQCPATVNFAKTFGLSFSTLATLGARILDAQAEGDPVTLGCLARELQVAEQVSGKRASITSKALMDEAVQLALDRFSSDELRALAVMAWDESSAKTLGQAAEAAKKREVDEEKASADGAQPKGISNNLFVTNHLDSHVRVYINGRYRGQVRPGCHATFFVGDCPSRSTRLKAVTCDGEAIVESVCESYCDYEWTIEGGGEGDGH